MEPTQVTQPSYQIDEPSFGAKLKNNVIELIEFVAIVFAILMAIRVFVAEPHKVSGNSMFPNFHDGDYIITNKLSLRYSELKRGEVIILQNPTNTNQIFIKRIIGLPGETLKISNGKVYINGELLEEPYLPNDLRTSGERYLKDGDEITVTGDNYFVMGDNRTNSSDSREFGLLNKNLIVGQAFLRYWPIDKTKLINIGIKSN